MLTQFKSWVLPAEEKQKRDVLLVPLSDFHTCGTTALFPYYDGRDLGIPPHRSMTGNNGEWRFKHGTYMPTAKQYMMFRHLTKCAEQIAAEKGNRRLVVVETGDSIEGTHHHSQQIATYNIREQVEVHVWLMQYFLHTIGFDSENGDVLYVGAGTETHTGDEEDGIAARLGAQVLPDGMDTFDFLPMDINGARFWFLHQGATAGRGITKGNALHSWMRNAYFSCLEESRVIPDCVISGHYHQSVYDTFTRRERTMHGIILPPFQTKTRFGYRVAASEFDSIGIRTVHIGGDGKIQVNAAMLMESRDEVIVV